MALAKKWKCVGEYAAIALGAMVGMALACVAGVVADYDPHTRFLYSPWMLPTVMLAVGGVLALDWALGFVLPGPKGGNGENRHV